jgi:hypothetical protein
MLRRKNGSMGANVSLWQGTTGQWTYVFVRATQPVGLHVA